MAGELASFGIQKLWDLVSREHKQFQGVTDQVTELQTDLTTLKSFLKDADVKKHTSEVVKNFIEEIKKIVFDAEDIIETFILKDELRINDGIKKRIRRLACILQERMDIASDMRGINKMISKVIRDMQSFGVQRIIDDCRDPQPFQQRIEFARKYEGHLVGLEENVEKLVGYLVEEDDVRMVSITGMGGLGKTTLARQAFNHDMVISKFDRAVWVCVTQVCDSMNVWRTILRILKPSEEEEKISKMTKASLQDELFRLLKTYK